MLHLVSSPSFEGRCTSRGKQRVCEILRTADTAAPPLLSAPPLHLSLFFFVLDCRPSDPRSAEGQLVALLPILLHLRLPLLLRLGPVVVPTPVHHHVARREDARQLDDAEADEPDPDGLDLRPEPPADGHGEDDQLPRVACTVITLLRVLYKFVGVGSRVVGRKE